VLPESDRILCFEVRIHTVLAYEWIRDISLDTDCLRRHSFVAGGEKTGGLWVVRCWRSFNSG
jgi:hypothetical protein